MSGTREQRWKVGGGAGIVLIILLPLWGELSAPGQTLWNAILFVMLVGIVAVTAMLHRHLLKNMDRVGEARFDTRNK